MDADDRIRRPRLDRTGPIRSSDALFGSGSRTAEKPLDGAPLNDVVSRSVELGYRVVDAYMRRGQEAAQRLRAGDYGTRDLVSEARDLASRMVRSMGELAAAWGDMADLTREGRVGAEDAPSPATAPPSAEVRATPRDPVRLRLRVAGAHALEATLDLNGAPLSEALIVPPLRTAAADGPLLRGVTFGYDSDQVRTLILVVPPDQPAGTYVGPVLDDEANHPVAWLTVTVGDGGRRGP
jgi:hypothetical protein